jgi:hypothetical protein
VQGEQKIAGGLNARRPSGDEFVALMRAFRGRVDECRRIGSVSPLMEYAYANMAKGAALLADMPIACASGCSHCCHSPWVDARPPEVIFATKWMSDEQRRRAAGALARSVGARHGKSLHERAEAAVACPLLQDHKCGIYDGRPVLCRSLVSTNAEICRRTYLEASGESFLSPATWRTLGAAYSVALEGALLDAGLASTSHSLADCLEIALQDSSAEAKWLAGQDVFQDAPRASETSNFDAPAWAYLYRQAFGGSPPLH